MTLEEKIWDAFTSLDESDMADMLERISYGVKVFEMCHFDNVMSKCGSLLELAETVQDAVEHNNFITDDKWCVYDENAGVLESSNDLLGDYACSHVDEIIEAIMAHEDIISELEIE